MTVLFVIATIVVFLSIDWVVQRLHRRAELPARTRQPEASYPLRIPDGVFFARSHTWLNLFPSGKIRLGVDDFVGSMLEHPKVTLLKRAGDGVEKGDPLLKLEQADHVLTVRAPISGDIVAVNDDLSANPELMRKMLFSNGWAYVIHPRKAEELRAMMIGDETRSWMSGEFQRLRDFFAGVAANGNLVPAAIQDGGAPVAGALKHLGDIGWKRFEDEFLRVQ